MKNKWVLKLGLALMIFDMVIPFLTPDGVANAATTTRVYLNLSNSSTNASTVEPTIESKYSSSSTKSGIVMDLSSIINDSITSFTVMKNGTPISGAQLNGKSITLPELQGDSVDIYGKSKSFPGHHMIRSPEGDSWSHKGAKTPSVVFDADSVSIEGGVSKWPGLIPQIGRLQSDGTPFNYDTTGSPATGPDLRYSYNHDRYKNSNESGDQSPDYSATGYAVTTDYNVPGPGAWYFDKSKIDINNGDYDLPSGKAASSTVKIISAETDTVDSPNAVPFSWGGGGDGNGILRMRMKLDSSVPDSHYIEVPYGTGSGIDRNYLMHGIVVWQAKTYKYDVYVDVVHEPSVKPDIIPVDIKTDKACFVIGDSVQFQYSWKNVGVSTSTTFKVSLMVDGVEVDSDIVEGQSSNILLGKNFTYKFTSAVERQFTLFVDSNQNIAEEISNNNGLTKTFVPQADCGGNGGGPSSITGDFTTSKTVIEWGTGMFVEPVNVVVTGNGCKYDGQKWRYRQPSTNTGYTSDIKPPNAIDALTYDPSNSSYLGDMGVGQVEITMELFSSCGDTATIGPKIVTIIADPNNRPPEVTIGWFRGSTETTEVTEGETVSIKIITEKDPDGDRTIRKWDFSSDSWTSSLPGKYNWNSALDRNGYNGILADTKGSHKVCINVKDVKGAAAQACATLFVIGPQPKAVITGGTMVKEGRTLDPPLSSKNSYSPVPGRTIDHSKDIWTNNSGVYNTPGTVTATLIVFDNTGLQSYNTARYDITVYPDIPPVPDFEYMSTMTRTGGNLRNKSYSSDGDNIIQYRTTWGYDSGNNGYCDPTTNLISTGSGYFTFIPPRIGDYCFRVYAKEDGLGKDAYKDYKLQVINDGPDAEFTATGEATEPSPINVVSYPASTLKTWTNTSLDKASMPNYWGVVGDTLISSRRTSNISQFAYPSSFNTQGTEAYTLKLPTGATQSRMSILHALGNDRFVAYDGESSIYIMSPTSMPVLISGSCAYHESGCRKYAYDNPNTDDLLIFIDRSYGSASGGYYTTSWEWQRFKLSDLRNGIVNLTGSGSYRNWTSTNNQSGTSGSYPTFSNGMQSGAVSLKFDQDYKIINLTTRTITSYRYDSISTPYKTETYDSMPLVPLTSTGKICNGAAWTCEETPHTAEVFLTADMMNANGDYIYRMKDGNYYKFDRLNGKPSLFINLGFIPTSTDISVDGQYLWARFKDPDPWCGGNGEDDVPCLPEQSKIINMVDGNVIGWNPFPTDKWPYWKDSTYKIGNNGFGLYYNIEHPFNNYKYYYGDVMARQGVQLTDNSPHYLSSIFEDGKYLSGSKVYSFTPESAQTSHSNESITFGQLMNSSSQNIGNGTVSWNMKFHHLNNKVLAAGVGFRIQNHKNMYRVEAMKDKLQLVKIINGRKTVIGEKQRTLLNESWASYKIRIFGDHIRVYENNSLAIDIYDNQFTWGTMGPFSTTDNTEIKGISYSYSAADIGYLTPGVSIVDTRVTYDVKYSDPESDPRLDARTQWNYSHVDTGMFLDANDGKSGLSSLHGTVVTNPVLTFDKVGKYKIDYRVPDDPHPEHRIANGDMLFAGYSKYSEWYTQNLIVHRRPISNFTIAQGGDRLIHWTDYSYDPDRCYNSGNCQQQSDYQHTRGIYQKKFYYITPGGQRVDGKLVRPTENGTYVVAMAVADEYKAWSDWYEQTIDVCIGCQAAPNNPPNVQLTFPNGTLENPSHVSLQPTITWNQWDADPGTVYETFDLNIKDEWGGCVECTKNQVMGTTQGNWAWTMDVSLTMGRKYSAQVRVSDGEAWSAWSGIGWMATNSPPSAYMSFPWGTHDIPNIVNTTQPQLTWVQSDPDAGTWFHFFQIQVINEANNHVIYDSGKVWQNTQSTNGSHNVPIDLPTGQKMRVHVKVWDQYGSESNWSPQTWMLINRPPVADFDWTPRPVYEGDAIHLFDRSSDPDGDALTYYWTIVAPNGNVTNSTMQNPSVIHPALVGNYTVTLKVTDIHGMSNEATRSIPVLPLTITGKVDHIPRWESLRQQSNLEKSNNAEIPWKKNQFLAGEPFELHSDTTVIEPGSTVYAQKVEVWWDQTTDRVMLTAKTPTSWNGEMWEESFINLNPTTAVFTFQVTYSNGTIKTTTVPVEILDDTIEQFWLLKRDK